jgi:phosphatidate cytidylyltransferase
VCAILFAAMVYRPEHSMMWFGLANVGFLTGGLWLSRGRVSNENLLAALALGSFGILYCVTFPFFIARTIWLDHGNLWFLFLLVVVFFGDIFAYLGGRLFGKHKLMVQVSPKKTWEGAVGGQLGSALAGVIFNLVCFSALPWWRTLVFCLICGVAAQSGDLLMSLVKRVAQVKDSGSIMPGHGGILDRLDGIFIACPLVYAFALYSGPF